MKKRYLGNHAPRINADASFGEEHQIMPGWSVKVKEELRSRSWRRRDALATGQGRMVRYTTQLGVLRYVSVYYKPFPLWKRLRNRFFARYRPKDPIAERLRVYATRQAEPTSIPVKRSNSHWLR